MTLLAHCMACPFPGKVQLALMIAAFLLIARYARHRHN